MIDFTTAYTLLRKIGWTDEAREAAHLAQGHNVNGGGGGLSLPRPAGRMVRERKPFARLPKGQKDSLAEMRREARRLDTEAMLQLLRGKK